MQSECVFGNNGATLTQRSKWNMQAQARLAQPTERKALNLVVVGSGATVGGP